MARAQDDATADAVPDPDATVTVTVPQKDGEIGIWAGNWPEKKVWAVSNNKLRASAADAAVIVANVEGATVS